MGILSVLLILGILLVIAIRRVHLETRSTKNLMTIGIALHEYRAIHGSFPPAYVPDANGNPMHSWRVLLLPHLGYEELYSRYRFDEPWDGPHNRVLAVELPNRYRSACGPGSPPTHTSFVAVIGNRTAWPGAQALTLDQFPDGADGTIAVLEMSSGGVNWMDPAEPRYDEVVSTHLRNTSETTRTIPLTGLCLFVSGRVGHLNTRQLDELLSALLTRDGGEQVYEDGRLKGSGAPVQRQ